MTRFTLQTDSQTNTQFIQFEKIDVEFYCRGITCTRHDTPLDVYVQLVPHNSISDKFHFADNKDPIRDYC